MVVVVSGMFNPEAMYRGSTGRDITVVHVQCGSRGSVADSGPAVFQHHQGAAA